MKDDSVIVASIIKHQACKLDGVANAITLPKLSKYLGEIADELITCSNDIEDNFMEKPAAPKPSPQHTDSTETMVEPDPELKAILGEAAVRPTLKPAEPVQPMADLSGYEFAASNGGGQVNPDFVDGPTTEEIEPIIPYFKQLSVERHYDPYFRKGVDGSLPEAD